MTKARFPRMGTIWMVVLTLCLVSACQPAAALAPSATTLRPTSISTQAGTPTVTVRATLTSLPSLTPTPTFTPRPTFPPSRTPIPTAVLGALSPGGPWLVLPDIINRGEAGREVNLILLNQDGSGGQKISVPKCGDIEESPDNVLVQLGYEIFLVNPRRGTAALTRTAYPCGQYASRGAQAGLWATTVQDADTGLPRLNVYRLPEGKLLHSFPLVRCTEITETCSADVWGWGPLGWIGNSLAFSVLLENETWGLYVYDGEQDQTRQVAHFQEIPVKAWSSSDGSALIVGVSSFSTGFEGDWYYLSGVEALWVVPLNGELPYKLYTFDIPNRMEVDDSLDKDRILLFSGTYSTIDEGPRNLRVMNVHTGEVQSLFQDGFDFVSLDRKDQTALVYTGPFSSVYDMYGYYLVSPKDAAPRRIPDPPNGNLSLRPGWREDLGLFVADSYSDCQEPPEGYWAVDLQGNWQCVQLPETANSGPKDIWVSPDQQWRVSARDRLWVEGPGQARQQVYPMNPKLVIWQPDSGGFFFTTLDSLYHVSVPDLTLTILAFAWAAVGTGVTRHRMSGLGENKEVREQRIESSQNALTALYLKYGLQIWLRVSVLVTPLFSFLCVCLSAL